ncbi:hypothetical protein JR316_0012793 [Psilocybe cubensis]|uniref:Uncharacterized protein n=2 Tax=Psilocybe cubensis TaxID=181762 RepID=A0ACB8GH13_PSICU|nr:hypothetical protein JR316_0012793 [Psilocybe cubensis]KAH9474335.1 hypothetical protein JR316_0012793 [Psilocybe cubensis]
MMCSSFLSLPLELLDVVAEKLDLADIKQLRLCCKRLGSSLESFTFHTISLRINCHNASSSSGIRKLQYLATQRHSGPSRMTKNLIIDCLAPDYDPTFEAESYVNGEWVANVPPKDLPQAIISRKQMKLYLFYALKSLKNLRSISWNIHQYDEQWVQCTVMNAIQTLPNLRSVRIEVDWARIPLPLHRLRGLRDITIIDSTIPSNSGNIYETYQNLGKMLARSPGLVGLNIQRGGYDCTHVDTSASLHHLLRCYPSSQTPLRLKHLVMNRMFVKLDAITLPHLHYLKSLDLSNVLEPHHITNIEHLTVDSKICSSCTQLHGSQKLVGSSVDGIWDALTNLGIELEVLKVRKVTQSLLNYLESYSGIKRLHILSSAHPTSPTEYDALASRFFGTSLGMHIRTIEKLDIEAANEGLWCFGPHNMSVIASCTALVFLGIPICSIHLQTFSCDDKPVLGSEDGAFDPIASLYDTITIHLVKINTLKVSVPLSIDRFEGYWCGYSVSRQFSWVCDTVAERLCAFSNDKPCYPPSCLPDIQIGDKTCKEKRLAPFATVRSVPAVDGAVQFRQAFCYKET